MSIEHAERLKKELTDQWVVVAAGVPELRRFEQFTGQVRTVNMNCRALVEFQGSEDIGWYDIDPQYLTVVDAPQPGRKASAEPKKTPKATGKAAPAAAAKSGGSPLDQIRAQAGGAAAPAKPAPAKPSGGSPLDQIRAQAGGAPAKPAAAKPASGSPLDQIRAQAAGTPAAAPAPEKAVEPANDDAPATAKSSVDTSGMSPLDVIRAQGAFKGDK